jgi:transposase
MRKGIVVDVGAEDRARLAAIVANRNSPQKHVWRARIVLLTADGLGTAAIMRQTGKSKSVVWRWQERFMQAGIGGLLRDKTRPSRKPPLDKAVIARVVELTAGEPPGEATHWTAAAMAEVTGISVSSVQRIWHSHGLAPHRVRRFKLSKDPKFADKLKDVVGLEACPRAGHRPDPRVDPPAHPVVLSVDEKSQIQGARPHPARPADEEGPRRHDDP